MATIRFGPLAECFIFTHASVGGEPVFRHHGGQAYWNWNGYRRECATWLWFMGASPEAVARMEGERDV